MHPVLADRKGLALYLLVWMLLAFLLALVTNESGRMPFSSAIRLTFPPTIAYAFLCLASWYPARALPLRAARVAAVLATHLLGALVFGGVWLVLFRLSAGLVDRIEGGLVKSEVVAARSFVFVITGVLLYLLSVAFHYLLLALANAREVEKRDMEVKVLAREAELKMLKAQLDPHFLFNSLNSISSLCGSNPSSARTLTTLLAEYLRKSLRFGSAESITLSEELELASSYLAIERIRFGPRLEVEQKIEEGVRSCRVPPLLLQPLVENAVTHGIANLIEGGVVTIGATAQNDQLRISVENPCDPDRPSSRRGEGIGLSNTKRRVETFFEGAHVEVSSEPERYRVVLVLPR